LARRRKKSDPLDELLDMLPGVLILGFLLLWGHWGSLTAATFITALIIASIIGVAFYFYRKYQKKLLLSGIHEIDSMSGEKFEELLRAYFKQNGYKVKLTPSTADYGADLILKKDNETTVVQAKRWDKNVGIKAVQETVGAVNHFNASRGIIISNSYYTANAEDLAMSNNIELWDRDKLINVLSKVQGKDIAKEVTTKKKTEDDYFTKDSSEKNCPRCGNALVLRTGKRGSFWGCQSFPKCRYTQNLS